MAAFADPFNEVAAPAPSVIVVLPPDGFLEVLEVCGLTEELADVSPEPDVFLAATVV